MVCTASSSGCSSSSSCCNYNNNSSSSSISNSSISSSVLAVSTTYKVEITAVVILKGYTLEEMQMSLYGEYGIKVSMNSLKRRLADDKSERKGKKRTGKTRREKTKARNLRFNPIKVGLLSTATFTNTSTTITTRLLVYH